jgi:hypothetical protein
MLRDHNERSELSGEAPTALPVEGVLNPNNERSELSGEAGAPTQWVVALPVEGVLNPNNWMMVQS